MSNPRAEPCVFVIFGASGDLTRRKLLPAIYNLAESGHLPDEFAVLGVARPQIDVAAYRTQMRERVRAAEGEPLEPEKWKRIEDRLYYVSGEFDDPALYERLGRELASLRTKHKMPPNDLFYLAIPPDLFATVAKGLAAAGLLSEDEGWQRVIIEKPFGYDLASARALNADLSSPASASRRSIGSITTSAKKPSRTSWRSGSPTGCLSRRGIAATWITCR